MLDDLFELTGGRTWRIFQWLITPTFRFLTVMCVDDLLPTFLGVSYIGPP